MPLKKRVCVVKPLILCFMSFSDAVPGGKVRSVPSAWSIQGASMDIAMAVPGSAFAKRIGVEYSVIKVSYNIINHRPLPLSLSSSLFPPLALLQGVKVRTSWYPFTPPLKSNRINHNWIIEIKTHWGREWEGSMIHIYGRDDRREQLNNYNSYHKYTCDDNSSGTPQSVITRSHPSIPVPGRVVIKSCGEWCNWYEYRAQKYIRVGIITKK